MLQASPLDGLALDPFAFGEDGLPAAEVDIGGWNTFTPLYHAGITSVLMRDFNPGLVLDLIHEGRVENFGAVEAMLQFLIAHPKFAETDFSRLKAIITAAAPCSKAVMKIFLDKGVPISQTYGMTEAGPSDCCLLYTSRCV